MSNFKTFIFLVLIVAISSKNFKKDSQPANPPKLRPDIMEIGFKKFIDNAGLDLEAFIKCAEDTCREAHIPCPERENLKAIFNIFDEDHNGSISGEEFKQVVEMIKEEVQRDPETNFVQRRNPRKKI